MKSTDTIARIPLKKPLIFIAVFIFGLMQKHFFDTDNKMISIDENSIEVPSGPVPASASGASEHPQSPVPSAGSFTMANHPLGILLFVIFWAVAFLVPPFVLSSSSETTLLPCTVTRCERYEDMPVFWIRYIVDNRTYNIRMCTPLGKNHVGSRVFINVNNEKLWEPLFLKDYPVPDDW